MGERRRRRRMRREAPGGFLGGCRQAPGEKTARKVINDAVIRGFGERGIYSPIFQGCSDLMKSERVSDRKIAASCAIGISCERRRADKEESAGGDIIG